MDIMGWLKTLNEKERFIRDMVLSNTISAAFQRAGVYRKGANKQEQVELDKQKRKFRENIGDYLIKLGEEFDSTSDHDERIKGLKRYIDTVGSHLLEKNKISLRREISFGVVQKLVNLYLKYLWCLRKCKRPPHCPIDAEILKKGKAEKFGPWTKIDEKKYKGVIEKIKETIKSDNLAGWELRTFNERNETYAQNI